MVSFMKVLNRLIFTGISLIISSQAISQEDIVFPDRVSEFVASSSQSSNQSSLPSIAVDSNSQNIGAERNSLFNRDDVIRDSQLISKKQFLQQQLKLDLENKTMEDEINKIDMGIAERKNPVPKVDEEKEKEIADLKLQVETLIASQKKTLHRTEAKVDEIQVIKVFGVGGDLYAMVKFNGIFMKKRAGERISEGITVQSVSDDGISLKNKGKTQFVSISSLYSSKSQRQERVNDLAPMDFPYPLAPKIN